MSEELISKVITDSILGVLMYVLITRVEKKLDTLCECIMKGR